MTTTPATSRVERRPGTGSTVASARAIALRSTRVSGRAQAALTACDRRRGVHGASGTEQREVGFQRRINAGGGERVRERERDARAAGSADDAAPQAHAGVGGGAEGQAAHPGRDAHEQQRLRGAGDRNACGVVQLRLFVRDALQRAQPFGMLDVDVEYEGDVGRDDLREAGDLAALIGAAFEDGRAMSVGEREDGHRHADEIVEIAGGRENIAEQRAG